MTTDKNPFYDGQMVFSLDVRKLCPGDIILTRNRWAKTAINRGLSSGIATATRTDFSHALIITVSPTAVEATLSGVSTHSIQNTFYHDEKNVMVLRYPDPKIAGQAAAKASLVIGKGYSIRMALKSILPDLFHTDAPKQSTFCSALVASAYRSSGAPEFVTISPYGVSPGDLERMVCLEDITSEVSHTMLSPENIEQLSALDGDRQISPMDGQAKAYADIYASVAGDVEAFYTVFNIPGEMPTTFFSTVIFLRQTLLKLSGDIDPKLEECRSALRSIDTKLANSIDSSNLKSIMDAAEVIDGESLSRDLHQSFEPNHNFSISNMRSLLESTDAQIKSRSSANNSQKGISKASDKCDELTIASIEGFKHRRAVLCEILNRIDPS